MTCNTRKHIHTRGGALAMCSLPHCSLTSQTEREREREEGAAGGVGVKERIEREGGGGGRQGDAAVKPVWTERHRATTTARTSQCRTWTNQDSRLKAEQRVARPPADSTLRTGVPETRDTKLFPLTVTCIVCLPIKTLSSYFFLTGRRQYNIFVFVMIEQQQLRIVLS